MRPEVEAEKKTRKMNALAERMSFEAFHKTSLPDPPRNCSEDVVIQIVFFWEIYSQHFEYGFYRKLDAYLGGVNRLRVLEGFQMLLGCLPLINRLLKKCSAAPSWAAQALVAPHKGGALREKWRHARLL